MALLPPSDRTDLINAILQSGFDVVGNRRAMLRGSVDAALIQVMDVLANPAAQLMADIGKLNTIERGRNGEVPLIVYLRNLEMLLSGDAEALEAVRKALSVLEQRASGAPPVDLAQVPEVKERLIHDTDDTVSFAFMDAGLRAGGAVAKLRVPRHKDGQPQLSKGQPVLYLGTGWLLTRALLITNHHVIQAREDGEPAATDLDLRKQAEGTRVQFDFDFESAAGVETGVSALEAWDRKLDYAVLRLNPISSRAPLARAAERLQVEADTVPVNIIQHPGGNAKRYGIRNNLVSASTELDLRYFTDTQSGSSGSPVLNDRWEVVALHRGSKFVQGVQFQGKRTAYVNVGTQWSAIQADLGARFPALAAELG